MSTCEENGTCDEVNKCDTLEQRLKLNEETPCKDSFNPVFPNWMIGMVSPSILLVGLTIIGYQISVNSPFITKYLPSPSVQLGVISLLLVADHASSFFDHSRISNEPYCLTAALSGDSFDSDKARMIFGGLSAALAAFSAYSFKTNSITMAATGIPFATIMAYLAWSPEKIQSCKANALVTGLLAGGLDIMTLVGILELLFAESGNTSTSWHMPTVLYASLVSVLFVVLIGRDSDYGDRISAENGCIINDEEDLAKEKETDRRGELYTGILLSVVSIVYFMYLKTSFSEVSCCAIYPTIMFLGFDILTKVQNWKKGEPLVGDAIHRGLVYTIVQVLDILLSSQALISVGVEKGMVGSGVPKVETSSLGHVFKFGTGSIYYIAFIARIAGALISGAGGKTSSGSLKTMAEATKLVSLNVFANIFPWFIDQMNASAMFFGNPRQLNNKCFVK